MVECDSCGANTGKGWKYCPNCGASVGQDSQIFSEVFDMLAEQLSEVNKMFENQVEAIDLSPWFKKGTHGRGFSIKIITSGGRQPKVSIQTFGDVDKAQLKRKVYDELGFEGGGQVVERPVKRATPKTTEEPKANIKNISNKLVVDLELPKVKTSDIEIREMPSSVEVKAVVGDKAYFKILTKPENKRITSKKFEKGVLHLEFS